MEYKNIKRTKDTGFTLMEVIVSVFIMSIIIITILPVYTSIMGAKKGMEMRGVREMREAQALMNLMKEDLKSAFLSKSTGDNKFIIINGRDFEGKPLDEIYFTSFSYPSVGTGYKASDQCEVGYFVQEDAEKRKLFRRVSTVIDSDVTTGGDDVMLTDSIEYFDVIAYTGGFFSEEEGIVTEGEDTLKQMPGAIMIKFGLKADDGSVSDYMTAIDLPSYIFTVEKKDDGTGDDKTGSDTGESEINSDESVDK